MYTEEPATNEWELQISSQSTQNIRKQEQTAQVLLEKCQCLQADWQEALATSSLGLWNWNLVTDNIYYTPDWKHILGYEAEEIENNHTSFKRHVHPQDLPKLCEVVNDYLEGRTPVYRGAEGSTLNVLIGWRLRAGGDKGIYDVCSPRVSAGVNVRRIAKYLRKFTSKQCIIILVATHPHG